MAKEDKKKKKSNKQKQKDIAQGIDKNAAAGKNKIDNLVGGVTESKTMQAVGRGLKDNMLTRGAKMTLGGALNLGAQAKAKMPGAKKEVARVAADAKIRATDAARKVADDAKTTLKDGNKVVRHKITNATIANAKKHGATNPARGASTAKGPNKGFSKDFSDKPKTTLSAADKRANKRTPYKATNTGEKASRSAQGKAKYAQAQANKASKVKMPTDASTGSNKRVAADRAEARTRNRADAANTKFDSARQAENNKAFDDARTSDAKRDAFLKEKGGRVKQTLTAGKNFGGGAFRAGGAAAAGGMVAEAAARVDEVGIEQAAAEFGTSVQKMGSNLAEHGLGYAGQELGQFASHPLQSTKEFITEDIPQGVSNLASGVVDSVTNLAAGGAAGMTSLYSQAVDDEPARFKPLYDNINKRLRGGSSFGEEFSSNYSPQAAAQQPGQQMPAGNSTQPGGGIPGIDPAVGGQQQPARTLAMPGNNIVPQAGTGFFKATGGGDPVAFNQDPLSDPLRAPEGEGNMFGNTGASGDLIRLGPGTNAANVNQAPQQRTGLSAAASGREFVSDAGEGDGRFSPGFKTGIDVMKESNYRRSGTLGDLAAYGTATRMAKNMNAKRQAGINERKTDSDIASNEAYNQYRNTLSGRANTLNVKDALDERRSGREEQRSVGKEFRDISARYAELQAQAEESSFGSSTDAANAAQGELERFTRGALELAGPDPYNTQNPDSMFAGTIISQASAGVANRGNIQQAIDAMTSSAFSASDIMDDQGRLIFNKQNLSRMSFQKDSDGDLVFGMDMSKEGKGGEVGLEVVPLFFAGELPPEVETYLTRATSTTPSHQRTLQSGGR